MRRALWISLVLFCFLLAFVGSANDSSYRVNPQSGNLIPLDNGAIRMVSEEVVFSSNEFMTIFRFLNTTAKAQEITIGFPIVGDFGGQNEDAEFWETYLGRLPAAESAAIYLEKLSAYCQFRSYVNGKEVARKLTKTEGGEYEYAYAFKLRFEPNQSLFVTNLYHQEPTALESVVGNEYTLRYIFRSGAAWKDTIGQANFRFYIDKSYFLYDYRPEDFAVNDYYEGVFSRYRLTTEPPVTRLSENSRNYICEWDFQNIEPKQDITVKWGFMPFDLDVPELEALIDDVLNNRLDGLKKRYPGFFGEMQSKFVFRDYIMAVSRCECLGKFSGSTVSRRFLTNCLYALYGYSFKTEQWQKFFSLFGWYKARTDSPIFPLEEEQMLESLKAGG